MCLRRDEQQVGQQVRDVVYPCAPVCASAAAAALRVWSIAPSSPLRDPGNSARTPLQPLFSCSRYLYVVHTVAVESELTDERARNYGTFPWFHPRVTDNALVFLSKASGF